jgi:hypothetical protein
VEKLRNFNKVQQPTEELLWLAHAIRLWTHIVDSKKQALRGLKMTDDDA